MSTTEQRAEGAAAPRAPVGLWARAAVLAVDWILMLGCMLVASLALVLVLVLVEALWGNDTRALAYYVLGYPLLLVGAAAYWLISLRRLGRSPGRMLLGLRCVRSSGAPLGPWRLVVRELALKFIPTLLTAGLWLGLCALVARRDPERHRGLHDRISDSRVESEAEPVQVRSGSEREHSEPSEPSPHA